MLVSQEYFSVMMGDVEVGEDVEFYMLKKISPTKAQQLVESDQPVAFCPKSQLISISGIENFTRTSQGIPAEDRKDERRTQFLLQRKLSSENQNRLLQVQ